MDTRPTELFHYGIKGMRWGVRRYQNKDGSYTQAGKERYDKAKSDYKSTKKSYRSGESTKEDVNKAKANYKKAESSLYKDTLADRGKELTEKGTDLDDIKRRIERESRSSTTVLNAMVGGQYALAGQQTALDSLNLKYESIVEYNKRIGKKAS